MNLKITFIFAGMALAVLGTANAQSARFTSFSYVGNDPRFNQQIDESSQYLNPVVAGFYPDPSVCRKDDTYYLANSSFGFFPGVPLFESKDLVSWKQVGHILDRDSQLPLAGNHPSAGIFAPDIQYNERNKTFYMTTMNMGNFTVFFVKTKDPSEGWSEPIYFKQGGMDSSFFFDKNGKAYLVYTTRPFGGQNYPGEMAIHVNEFDVKGDSLCSDAVEIVRGGTDDVENPEWLEGPHIYRVGKYYYLMCAQGGTGAGHTEVIFRSKNVYGPYEQCPTNPILAQQEVDCDYPVSSTGHADLIQTKEGDWYAVFLGCRPYKDDYYNTGRETFLLPVNWEDGWPRILPKGDAVPTVVNKAGLQTNVERPTGNFAYSTDFSGDKLDLCWVYLRNPKRECFHLDDDGLVIDALPTTIEGTDQVSAIFHRQHHTNFTATTEVEFTPAEGNDLAGFVLFQDESHNTVFGKTVVDGKPALTLRRTEKESSLNIATAFIGGEGKISLKIEGQGQYYTFSYSEDGISWQTLAKGVDATNLSTHSAGGFICSMIGLYSTSSQNRSSM